MVEQVEISAQRAFAPEIGLGVAWWNTGLSPNADQARATPEELQIAADMLSLLCHQRLHFIALGEVGTAEIGQLDRLSDARAEGYTLLDTTDSAGRSHFDTCIAYRQDDLTLLKKKLLLSKTAGRTARVGQHFQLIENESGALLHAVVSHWPSRLSLYEDAPKRIELGLRLRDKVDEILLADPDSNIVLLGDYNDEPFDSSISQALRATRDRNFLENRHDLLYNPFWRHLSSYEHLHPPGQLSDPGTYFHRGGEVTRWRTFDHMMFSSSLIRGAAGLRLDEHVTRVVDVPIYTAMVKARRHVFDHLPIMGRLMRSANHA